MKPETDPISDDEWLLRRVPVDRFRNDKMPIISPNAFEPRTGGRDIDAEGLSFFREACLAKPEEILIRTPEVRRSAIGIVRIPVAFFSSLGLTIVKNKDDLILGHVYIPELNAVNYKNDKSKFTDIKLKLAEKASEEGNIVKTPAK